MADDRSTDNPSSAAFTAKAVHGVHRAGGEALEIAHMRMRNSRRLGAEGEAATPGSLAAEVRALSRALTEARPMRCGSDKERLAARTFVRGAYLSIAASAILLAERAGRVQP